MSSASIAVYRIQAACFVGRGDGKLAQRVREFQQLRGLGMLRDNRVGVIVLDMAVGCLRLQSRSQNLQTVGFGSKSQCGVMCGHDKLDAGRIFPQ